MSTMKFPKDDMLEVIDMEKGEKEGKYEVVDVGDWVGDGRGKYSYQEIVFTHEDHPSKFFSVTISRTGSYYSEWNYDSEYWKDEVEVDEVKKVEVVRYEWKSV